jgi:hypothetical protein
MPSPVAPGQCIPKPPKRAWKRGRKAKTGQNAVPAMYVGRTTSHADRKAGLDNAIAREIYRKRAITGCCP